ncbi:hypothetical protein BSKO_12422 [Bryopsis sp. KO-2023]|nr:hypothetical protein BSKO_12422 [Bryopsis sp. KO-2023]
MPHLTKVVVIGMLILSSECSAHRPTTFDGSKSPFPGGAMSKRPRPFTKSPNKSRMEAAAEMTTPRSPSRPTANDSTLFLRALSQAFPKANLVIHGESIGMTSDLDVHDAGMPDSEEEYGLWEFDDDECGDGGGCVTKTHRGIIENDFTERRHEWPVSDDSHPNGNARENGCYEEFFFVGWLLITVAMLFQFKLL